MANRIIISITILILLAFCSPLLAEVPAPLRDVRVTASLTYNSGTGMYTYRYSVYTPTSNSLDVGAVGIDISQPSNGKQLNAEGLVIYEGMNRKGDMMKTSFEEELIRRGTTIEVPIIPIGLAAPKETWGGGFTSYGIARWGARSEEAVLKPGESIEGCTLNTRGIPTLRNMTVYPFYIAGDEDLLQSGYTKDELIMNRDELLGKFYQSIAFHTKTVGPTAPPEDLNYQDFLDSIIGMKHEAYELGWITSEGVEKSLDAKLDAAKKKLLSGSFVPARKILDAFVNEVEAQGCESYDDCPKGKHLKPEAYALLKYNALYLIDHLK